MLKFVEHIDFAAEAAGLHREKDIAAELKRLAEEHAAAGDRQAAVIAAAQFADGAALARFEHLASGFQQQQDVAKRHAEDDHEDHRNAEYAQGFEHVGPRSGEDQEHARAWRRSRRAGCR